MAKGVTAHQLATWLAENKHRTWERSDFTHQTRSLEIKYLDICLDTRDMEIFSITTRGIETLHVHEKEEFEGNILELLTRKLDQTKAVRDGRPA